MNHLEVNNCSSVPPVKSCLLAQFEIAWQLLSYHLQTLTTEECLWRPAAVGLHIEQDAHGQWRGRFPEREDYDIGPASIGWISWHIVFWWSMVLNHSFGDQTLQPHDVAWPGNASALREKLAALKSEWLKAVETMSDADFPASTRTRWPLQGKPFRDIVAWVNVELMKNAAEIGYVRFLYAVKA